MQNIGNGVCSWMHWGNNDKKQIKQNKGILKFSAHNKILNYANALVAYLLKQMASLCGQPNPSHVPAVRNRDATLVLASWSHAKILSLH